VENAQKRLQQQERMLESFRKFSKKEVLLQFDFFIVQISLFNILFSSLT
jgi:hypothetical protein